MNQDGSCKRLLELLSQRGTSSFPPCSFGPMDSPEPGPLLGVNLGRQPSQKLAAWYFLLLAAHAGGFPQVSDHLSVSHVQGWCVKLTRGRAWWLLTSDLSRSYPDIGFEGRHFDGGQASIPRDGDMGHAGIVLTLVL